MKAGEVYPLKDSQPSNAQKPSMRDPRAQVQRPRQWPGMHLSFRFINIRSCDVQLPKAIVLTPAATVPTPAPTKTLSPAPWRPDDR